MFARGGACSRTSGMNRHAAFAVVLVGALAAAPVAPAADASIIGKWEIVEAQPAPWSKPENREALTAEGKGLMHLAVTFEPQSVKSKFKLFSCKRKVIYQAVDLPVDTLFQGNLPEPNPAAAAVRMGFPRGDVPSVDVHCLKAKFTFHFRDRDTALININRVIYTFKRR
jgi:hypothetical protein